MAWSLRRIADALERSAERGPTEDAQARAAVTALDKSVREAFASLAPRLAALEKGSDAALLKRALEAEARIEKLERDLRSLRGKVYRDPEFHQPQREQAQAAPVFEIGGAMPLAAEAED